MATKDSNDLEALKLALQESADRSKKSTDEAKSLHKQQLEMLRTAIADERRYKIFDISFRL
jgi:hypothetical protein